MVTPPLRPSGVGNVFKKVRERFHMLSAEHDFWTSYAVSGFENRPG